jgi:hypothetical protein
MADTGIFATTSEVQAKVGANSSATYNAEAYINKYMTEAESYINSVCCFNFSDAYATLNVDVKGLLKEAASNIAAMYVIQADMSGFPSLREAETRLDVLNNRIEKALSQLKEKAVIGFIRGA